MDQRVDGRALAREVASGNFADERLTTRLGLLVESLANDPSMSLPRSFNAAELEAAYRFFSNVHVNITDILAAHVGATKRRVAEAKRVLVVHDSTDFSFRPDGARRGLGRARSSNQTFYGHFSLVLSADGSRKPLGLAEVTTWVRGPKADGTEHERWLRQIESTAKTLELGTRAIHVFDREGDDYYLFWRAITEGVRFVTRADTDRNTVDGDGVVTKLRTAVTTVEHVVERTAYLSRRRQERSPAKAKTHPARASRTARLSVSAAPIALVRPMNYGKAKYPDRGSLPKSLDVNVVRVWEPEPPEGCKAVEWILYTNESIATVDDILDVVDHYRGRWVIEEYFKALKTGCAFEKRQLHDYDSLVNLLGVLAPIAYQLLLIRTEARIEPDAPALCVVSQDQLDVLRALGRRPLPDNPTARDVMLCIAALGGHIKYAPDPGWITLGRGYETLATLTEGWVAAKLQPRCDQR
jgi:hypothetical protein